MTRRPGFTQLVLIEPGVYWRVFDLDYQAEQFEVFHRSLLTRCVHYAGTQVIVAAFLLLGWGAHIGPVPVPLLVGLALSAWYLRMNLFVGLVASAQVALLSALVGISHDSLHFGASDGLVTLAVAALAQNLSHSVEPVPPTLTGRGFEPFTTYWPRASTGARVLLVALNAFYLPLELVSAPRLFAVHVLRALQRLGWRRDWAADVVRRADVILRGPAR